VSGKERLDNAEQSLKTGDFDGLKKSVANMSDPTDTKIFMTLMADRVKDQTGLHNITIVDANKDGVPEKIKYDKLTLENKGTGVEAKSEGFMDGIKEKIGNAYDSAKKSANNILEAVNVSEPLSRSGTSDSNLNRYWQNRERQAGLEDGKK
jgi:hypothetical protein